MWQACFHASSLTFQRINSKKIRSFFEFISEFCLKTCNKKKVYIKNTFSYELQQGW